MASMTDRTNIVAKVMQALYTSSTSFTITPGTGGGSAFTVTPPFHLRLMTAQGSNTSNGTELSATGYTAGGSTMGTTAFGAPSAGVSSSSNAVSWTAGAAWSAVVAVEIWDTAATPVQPTTAASGLVPVAPVRILDTRSSSKIGNITGPLGSGATDSVPIAGTTTVSIIDAMTPPWTTPAG